MPPSPPPSPSTDDPREPRGEGGGSRYPSLITRVSPDEYAAFRAAASRSAERPSAHLRAVIRSYLSGKQDNPVPARPSGPVDVEVERFELRLPSFLKKAVKARAAKENMSSSEWVASLIQTALAADPVLTAREAEAVSFSNRELAAIGRNLNQIARSMNRAELIGANFNKDEVLTLHGITVLNKKIDKVRSAILSLVRARNRAWGFDDDAES